MSNLLSYQLTGQRGPSLVLLHGFCEDKSMWGTLHMALSNTYRVLSIDLPGFGENPSIAQDAISIEEMAEAVSATINSLGIGPYVCVGHSLGGYVALALAETAGEDFRGGGLFHSSALADDEAKKEAREKAIDFVAEHGLATFLPTFYKGLVAEENHAQLESYLPDLLKMGQKTTGEDFAKVMRAMKNRPDRCHILESATCPWLFIAGREDRALDFEHVRAQVFLAPNLQLSVMKGVGHMGMFEQPHVCQAAIQSFLYACFEA